MPPGAFPRWYARWVVRLRWLVVAAWAVVLAGALVGPGIEPGSNELASIIPKDSPAIQTEVRSLETFGFPIASRTAVVQRDPDGLSPFVQAESVLDALAQDQPPPPPPPLLGAMPLTNGLKMGGAAESGTTVLTNLFIDPRSSFSWQQHAAERYVAEHLDRPEDHVVGITGSIPARAQQASLVEEYLPRLELFTVLAIVVLVSFAFRSLVAPVIALLAAGVAFLVTVRASAVLGAVLGVAAPAELEPLLVALLLGVVTDYTIFYVTALRIQLPRFTNQRDAVEAAVATYTPIVAVAGLTVAAGTGALLAARSEFFRGLGPAMTLAIVVGLVVSITLVPAMLAILGPRVLWPGRLLPARLVPARSSRPPGTGRLGRRLRGIHLLERMTRRRTAAAVLAVGVGLLAVAALPIRNLELGVGFTSALPADNPVRVASDAAVAGFAPGITSPTTLLVEAPGVSENLDELSRLQQQVESQPGVAGVIGPAQNVTRQPLGVVVSRSGDAARMMVILDHDPLGATAIDDLTRLRTQMPAMVEASGLVDAQVRFAGDTALAEGLVTSTSGDLNRIATVAIVVNLLLLIVFLRSLVAPVLLLACSVLVLAASLGLTSYLFVDRGSGDGMTFYVPFAAAVLLVSLGSDYNIFGVGRVWDEARQMPVREAVIKAFPETSSAITTAGLTLAVSFGMLAIIPLSPFRELGFAMAVGILLDAFLVRSILVPCLLSLLGRWSRWPGPEIRRWRTRSADPDAAGPADTGNGGTGDVTRGRGGIPSTSPAAT